MSKECDESTLLNILKNVISQKFHKHLVDWLTGAKVTEKKGLFLLSKIIANKGMKTFVDHKTLKPETDINAVNFKAALARYKYKSNSTTYKTDFMHGTSSLYKNIFEDRELQHTPYSEFLNSLSIHYIQSWLNREKCEEYKEMVLEFLRSFYSTVKSNGKFRTVTKDSYNAYKRHENFTQDPFFSDGKNPQIIQYPTVDELRKILKIDELKEKIANIPPIVFNDNLENMEFIEKKKQELVRGKKNLLKGIYGSTTTTVYQECFKGHPEKFKFYFKPDIFTSGVKGKIPDPYMSLRMEKSTTINDELSKKVKEIF